MWGLGRTRRPRTLKTKDLRSIAIVMGLGVTLFAAGCGSNAPCNTDPAQIEALRAELAAAEQQAESASAELAQAEQQKAQFEKDAAALPDSGELEAQLEVLKKGSGR
jgi:outer membrane murein-binding lipoprotein Lpp